MTRTAHEIMLPAVSDADCAQFWGIAATLRMCAGHSSSASLGICSVSHAQPLYRLLSVSLCIHNSAPGIGEPHDSVRLKPQERRQETTKDQRRAKC